MINQTACECSAEGWCERHRMYKQRQLFLLCSRVPELFQQWEMGQGLGQDGTAVRPLPPCIHRGLEPLEWVTCSLCGANTTQLPVFSCLIHSECTERRFNYLHPTDRNLKACTGCTSYAPKDEAPVEDADIETVS